MSLLKRAGNCLNDLQEKFEAEMEEFEAVSSLLPSELTMPCCS